jgi:hypothetical protein
MTTRLSLLHQVLKNPSYHPRKCFSSYSKGPSDGDDLIQEEFELEFALYKLLVTSKKEAVVFKNQLLKKYGYRKGTAYFAMIEIRNIIFFGISPYNLEDCEDQNSEISDSEDENSEISDSEDQDRK